MYISEQCSQHYPKTDWKLAQRCPAPLPSWWAMPLSCPLAYPALHLMEESYCETQKSLWETCPYRMRWGLWLCHTSTKAWFRPGENIQSHPGYLERLVPCDESLLGLYGSCRNCNVGGFPSEGITLAKAADEWGCALGRNTEASHTSSERMMELCSLTVPGSWKLMNVVHEDSIFRILTWGTWFLASERVRCGLSLGGISVASCMIWQDVRTWFGTSLRLTL